jgi:leucyl-tRNA synthetase
VESETENQLEEAFTEEGVLINSDSWNGKTSKDAIKEMTKFAEDEGFGEGSTTYRLRDWGISRQRFWGSPIPIVYCESCGAVPVPFENLPVELPESAPFTGVGESPLAKVPEFVNTTCPKCGEDAKRETDTMDTFVDSSWYYFRYCDPHNSEMPFDSEIVNYWMPVDQYIGGIDHAVMHLLYTRFWTKVCHELGLVDFVEPAKRLLTQGMVVTDSFYSTEKESYVAAEDVEIERDKSGKVIGAKLKSDGSDVRIAVEKMGKSKLNGIDPNDMILIYGADSVRIFSMFAAPVENELVWQETGIEGAVRFIQRVWRFVFKWRMKSREWREMSVENLEFSDDAKKLRQKTHQTIHRITENFESGQFNTPVAALMELLNAMYEFKVEPKNANDGDLLAVREACECLILMLTPYAPHVSEELWEAVSGSDAGILESNARFPVADEEIAKEDEIEIAVQVNGKLRSRVNISADASKDDLEKAALNDERIKEYTNEKEIVKIIVVPNRLVNVVVKG